MSGIVITDEMVEVAARAMWDRACDEYSFDEAKAGKHSAWEWSAEDARAALEAALALVPHPPEGEKEADQELLAALLDLAEKVSQFSGICSSTGNDLTDRMIGEMYLSLCRANRLRRASLSPIPARDTDGAEGEPCGLSDPTTRDCPNMKVKPLEKLPAAFEVHDTENGVYITRSEEAARRTGYEYRGLYRRAYDFATLSLSPGTGEKDERIAELEAALRDIREKASQGMSHGLTADATCEDIAVMASAVLPAKEG